MSEYLRIHPDIVRNAVINAIIRANALGERILIKSDTVSLNSKYEIEFEIHTEDFTTDSEYDENLTIWQNNIKIIILLLEDYNTKRYNHIKIESKLLRYNSKFDLFSMRDCTKCINSCAYIRDVNTAIDAVKNINIVPFSRYV